MLGELTILLAVRKQKKERKRSVYTNRLSPIETFSFVKLRKRVDPEEEERNRSVSSVNFSRWNGEGREEKHSNPLTRSIGVLDRWWRRRRASYNGQRGSSLARERDSSYNRANVVANV